MILILKDYAGSTTGKTVDILQEKIAAKGFDVQTANFEEDVEFFMEKDDVQALIKGKKLSEHSVVFVRKAGKHKNEAFALSQLAQKEGVYFLDNKWKKFFAPGKFQQMFILALNGASVPKTYFSACYSKNHLKNAAKYLQFPIIVKLSVSKQGAGVFMAKDIKELEGVVKENKEIEMIMQEYIHNKFDYRILVLGGKIAVAEKRTRKSDEDFRNNVFLGAEEEFLSLEKVPESVGALATQASNIFDIQVAGADIVVAENGEAYVLEVNSTPAFTHDEKISNELEKLADYIILCETKKI